MKKTILSIILLLGMVPMLRQGGLALAPANLLYAQETFESQTEVEAQQQAMEACGCLPDTEPCASFKKWVGKNYNGEGTYYDNENGISYHTQNFSCVSENFYLPRWE